MQLCKVQNWVKIKIVTRTCMLYRCKPLLLSTWLGVLFLVQFNNLPRLQASIQVTCSYSSHLFLCTLGYKQELMSAAKRFISSWYKYSLLNTKDDVCVQHSCVQNAGKETTHWSTASDRWDTRSYFCQDEKVSHMAISCSVVAFETVCST